MKKKLKKITIFRFSIIIFLLLLVGFNVENLDFSESALKQTQIQKSIELENEIEVFFCPSEKCLEVYYNEVYNSKNEVKCAFYDFTEENLVNLFNEKSQNVSIEIIVEDKNLDKLNLNDNIKVFSDKLSGNRYNNLMHHKFCVIDNSTLILGSANPTENGFFYNNNDILKIKNTEVSKLFLDEFNQMKNNKFSVSKSILNKDKSFEFSFNNETFLMDIYLCPQDNCEEDLLEKLKSTKKEILFLSFVMTNDKIEDFLKNTNVSVVGIIENRNRNTISSIYKDFSNEFELLLDKNKKTMHHKLFIIDKKYIITGSSNPTKSGLNYNDEFFLIIENQNFVDRYVENFYKIYNETKVNN